MTPLRAMPLLAVLLTLTALLRPLSAHNGAVAIAVPVEGIGAEELVDRLMSRAREFAGEEPQADAMTCVVVRVEG